MGAFSFLGALDDCNGKASVYFTTVLPNIVYTPF